MTAFDEQAPEVEFQDADVVILGAGGAARGALPALLSAGVGRIWLLNRTEARARDLAELFGSRVQALPIEEAAAAFGGSCVVINASAAGLEGRDGPALPLDRLATGSAVMDMVYRPILTPLLREAQSLGLRTVDGLAMLIGQARPSFEAFFGHPAPGGDAARSWALAHLAPP
jgi:shikimate dehydrogenase